MSGAWGGVRSMSIAEIAKLRAMFNKEEKKRFVPVGDNHLSANDCHLWSLCYHVLQKFGEPVMFKHHRMHVPHRLDERIEWFIPQGSKFEPIKQYLYYELRRDIRKATEITLSDGTTEYYPGTQIEFYPFSGISSYLERDVSEKMVRNLIKSFGKKNLREFIDYEFESKHFKRGWVLGSVLSALLMATFFWVRW